MPFGRFTKDKKKGSKEEEKKKGGKEEKKENGKEVKKSNDKDKTEKDSSKDSKAKNNSSKKPKKDDKKEEKNLFPEDDEREPESEPEEEEIQKGPDFEWKIENFSSLPDKRHESEIFSVGETKWRLLLFPFGTQGSSQKRDISTYLEVADPLGHGWTRTADFIITIVNQKDKEKSISKHSKHRFYATEKDWGFNGLLRRADVNTGFVVDDTMIMNVEITLASNRTHHEAYYLNWDSKKETGFVGFKNQGATCYMNSLLQALYHLGGFRIAVYQMPTHNDEPSKSIPLALQRVFYRLQFGSKAVGTTELTESFGWTKRDAFVQHDVQELNRVFCDKLEEKMKNTMSEGAIEKLFRGKIYNYIQCMNVKFESSRIETFYDVSLNVKGCKNLRASLDEYIAPEVLDGDNKYDAGVHGLQPAKKGCNFQTLPPVLEFHLKRFIYDPMTDKNCKVNDRYEYPNSIDMRNFLHKDSEMFTSGESTVYRLYAVLVHSGDVHGGHYYAYSRPGLKNRWYKFNDERVTRARVREVFDDSFGGDPKFTPGGRRAPSRTSSKSANAYMLFYVLDSAREQILANVSENLIPSHLKERFDREEAEKAKERKEKEEAHLYLKLKVILASDFAKWRSFDLVNFDAVSVYKLKKDSNLTEFKKIAEQDFGIPESRQRYWTWAKRRNGTVRIDIPYTGPQENLQLRELLKKNQSDINVFLEASTKDESEITADSKMFPPHTNTDAIIFFKCYDPFSESDPLTYSGYFTVKVDQKVESIIPRVNKLKSFPEDTELLLYEEIKPAMVDPIDLTKSFTENELGNGDIICFQISPKSKEKSPKENSESPKNILFPKAPEYYEHMRNRMLVRFRKLNNPREDVCVLELDKPMSYDDVVEKLGTKINIDPMKIRLTQHSSFSDKPKLLPVKRNSNPTLADMLQGVSRGGVRTGQLVDILYFEELDISIKDLESNKMLKIEWFGKHVKCKDVLKILVPLDSKFENVVEAVKKQVKLKKTQKIKILEVNNHKITRIVDESEKVSGYSEFTYLRAEEIGEDEDKKERGDRILHVVHLQAESTGLRPFADPFHLLVKKGEKFSVTKQKIKDKLQLSDSEISKWKFLSVPWIGRAYRLNDDDVTAEKIDRDALLGLEHKLPRVARPEIGIVIKT